MEKLIILPESDLELLNECNVTTFRSSGPGGQHVNKTDSAVRIVHRASGVVAISRKERSQYLNKKACLESLRNKIIKINKKDPPRIATKVPGSAKVKRREKKEIVSGRKLLRKRPVIID